MTALSPLKKIEKIDEATSLVMTYQKDIKSIIEKGLVDQTLGNLEPYIESMSRIAPDIATMDMKTKDKFQHSITAFRVALDELLKATIQIKEESIAESQKLKTHHKSAAAYIKADNGAGI